MPLKKQDLNRIVSFIRPQLLETVRQLVRAGALTGADFPAHAIALPHARTHEFNPGSEGVDEVHVDNVSALCVNRSGFDIAEEQVVYVAGVDFDEDFGLARPSIALADASDPLKMPPFGVTVGPILDGGEARVIRLGRIELVDTDTPGWLTGQELYLSQTTPGAMQNTIPASGVIYQIATVLGNEQELGYEAEPGGSGQLLIQIENMTDIVGPGAGGYNHARSMIRANGRC